jgi:glucose-6-phosphate isomerase
MAKGDRVTYDPTGTFLPDAGISTTELVALTTRLNAIRHAMTGGNSAGQEVPNAREEGFPGGFSFFELPERILDEYVELRGQSVLGRILTTARQMRDRVDQIVVLGDRSVDRSVRALLDACCEPYFNQLTRAQRGGRPRVYFAGSDLDNDATAGLLTLLTEGRSPDRLEDRWAILLCDGTGTSPQTRVVFRHFLSALRSFYRGDMASLADCVIPVATSSGTLSAIAERLSCTHAFLVREGIDNRFLMFSPEVLLPAAIVGADVVRLLEGASAMNDHFQVAPVGENAVLDFAALGHLWESDPHVRIRGLRIWAAALESAARWYVHLRERVVGQGRGSEAIAKGSFAASNSAGETRSVLGASPGSTQTRRVFWTNLIVEQCRCDPLAFGCHESDPDSWNDFAGRTLPEMLSSAIRETSRRDHQDGIPTADIRLARLNEHTLGQLVQMWMLAAVVEQLLDPLDCGTDSSCERRSEDFAVRFLYGPASICYIE